MRYRSLQVLEGAKLPSQQQAPPARLTWAGAGQGASSYRPRPSGIGFQGQKELQPAFVGLTMPDRSEWFEFLLLRAGGGRECGLLCAHLTHLSASGSAPMPGPGLLQTPLPLGPTDPPPPLVPVAIHRMGGTGRPWSLNLARVWPKQNWLSAPSPFQMNHMSSSADRGTNQLSHVLA